MRINIIHNCDCPSGLRELGIFSQPNAMAL